MTYARLYVFVTLCLHLHLGIGSAVGATTGVLQIASVFHSFYDGGRPWMLTGGQVILFTVCMNTSLWGHIDS
jgi:hypothetical protein